MYKKKFFFIVFEGVEGTGKTYQIKKLFNNLKKNNHAVIKTREPGGSYTAEKIRRLIFDKKSKKLDKLTDYYLINASRNEHMVNTLLPAKNKKQIVVCDRFVDSTYAYQVIGSGINKKLNLFNQKYILKNLKPDLTIILKSNFGVVFDRLKKRKLKNKFDKLKINFYRKAQNAFINIAKKNKNKYYIFDSSKNDKELEKKIFQLVLKKIKK